MTIAFAVWVFSAVVWLGVTVADNPNKVLIWLGEAARLTFFAAMLAWLLSTSVKVVF